MCMYHVVGLCSVCGVYGLGVWGGEVRVWCVYTWWGMCVAWGVHGVMCGVCMQYICSVCVVWCVYVVWWLCVWYVMWCMDVLCVMCVWCGRYV